MRFLGEELGRAIGWEEHHRRLVARVITLLGLTLVVDVVATVAVYFAERHGPKTEITTLGDAFFFTTVQLLTISSQLKNPVTTWGRVVDVVLELWGVCVVAGVAGAAASFFLQVDQSG
jgi:voltage-gated potassium channel